MTDIPTERLLLRELRHDAWASIASGFWPHEFRRRTRKASVLPEWLQHLGERMMRSGRGSHGPRWRAWLILEAPWPEPHGVVVLIGAVRRGETVEIGWTLDPASEGHGYASEAVEGVARWAVGTNGVVAIVADISTNNPVSAAVAERVGFRRAGSAAVECGSDSNRWVFTAECLTGTS